MSNTNWEEVSVPRGAYVGWGTTPGQHVTGKVLEYSPTGGTNYAGDPCPQLSVELIEPAASFNKAGERTDFPAGEFVVITCGQASLKRAVQAAALSVGDLVKITFSGTYKSANGEGKEFAIKVARGAAQHATPQPATGFGNTPQAAPPF
jgi:hypothetical protein